MTFVLAVVLYLCMFLYKAAHKYCLLTFSRV